PVLSPAAGLRPLESPARGHLRAADELRGPPRSPRRTASRLGLRPNAGGRRPAPASSTGIKVYFSRKPRVFAPTALLFQLLAEGPVMLEAVRSLQNQMEGQGYITDQAIATTVYLAMALHKPVLIEGQAGVGK